jgi:hypothetical protein
MLIRNVSQFIKYANSGNRSHYHRVPITELDSFRKEFAKYGIFYKVRYRGPRFNVPSARGRSYSTKASTCLKQDATHFSAYPY